MNEIDREARPSEMPSCRDCGEPVDQTSLFRRPSEIPNDCHWMCWEANADRRSLTAQLAALRDERDQRKRGHEWFLGELDKIMIDDVDGDEGFEQLFINWASGLRDERDRAVRVLKVVASGAERNTENYGLDLRGWNVTAYDFEDVPGDFDYLRQLIESEEG